MTHSSNAAKSFQKLLQIVMSQAPSEIDVIATSTQLEMDDARIPVTRGAKENKKKKTNKRRKSEKAVMPQWKKLKWIYDTIIMRMMKSRYLKSS